MSDPGRKAISKLQHSDKELLQSLELLTLAERQLLRDLAAGKSGHGLVHDETAGANVEYLRRTVRERLGRWGYGRLGSGMWQSGPMRWSSARLSSDDDGPVTPESAGDWQVLAKAYFGDEEAKLLRVRGLALRRLIGALPGMGGKAWTKALYGRVVAIGGNYRAAALLYESALRDLESTDRPMRLLEGLLHHDIANALAMFGMRADAVEAAHRSAAIFRRAMGREEAEGRIPGYARLGYLRSLVVEQQAECYRGDVVRVRELRKQIRQQKHLLSRDDDGPGKPDWYGEAKSLHFMALSSLYDARYRDAIRWARLSNAAANRIPKTRWLGLSLKRDAIREQLHWLFRDGGPLGSGWWRAVASATLADVYALAALSGDEALWEEAREAYSINQRILRSLWGRGARRMVSAVGSYRWALIARDGGETSSAWRHAAEILEENLRLARRLDFRIYMSIAELNASCLAREHLGQSEVPFTAAPSFDHAELMSSADHADDRGSAQIHRMALRRWYLPQRGPNTGVADRPGALMFDVDGVLTDLGAQVDTRVLGTIARLGQEGCPIALVTGRSREWLSTNVFPHWRIHWQSRRGFTSDRIPVAAEYGGVVGRGLSVETWSIRPPTVPDPVRRRLDEAAREWPGVLELDRTKEVVATVEAIHVGDDVVRGAEQALNRILATAADLVGDLELAVRRASYAVDVIPLGRDKHLAGREVAEELPARPGALYAFGDSPEDIEMAVGATEAGWDEVIFVWLGTGRPPSKRGVRSIAPTSLYSAGCAEILESLLPLIGSRR